MKLANGLLAVGLLFVASRVAAQIEAEPSARAAACVVVNASPLEYPPGQAELKVGGIVRVRLTFESADAAPRSEVFYDTVGGVFRAVVLDRVEHYRLPCLRAGDLPAVVLQEFVFAPGDGRKVVWSPLRDEGRGSTADRLLKCLKGAEQVPEYPSRIIDSRGNGAVLARYTFRDADSPPDVEILFDGGSARFASSVRRYAANLRFPCLAAADVPFKPVQAFRFRLRGDRQVVLKDASLADFVKGIDKLGAEQVRFDFKTMSCPFDLRLVLRQPVLPNLVGEVERSDPNRREFLEWLKTVSLRMTGEERAQVLGDSMTLSVPCGMLDLS